MQSKLFAPLPAQDLDVILSYAKFLEYAPQEPIFRQGESPDSFFLVLRGDVGLVALDANQQMVEMAQVGASDIFGESSLLLNQPRAFSAMAKNQVYVLRLRSEVLSLMIEGSPSFARDLSVALASRFVQTGQQVARVASSSSTGSGGALSTEDEHGLPSKVNRRRFSPTEVRQRLAMIEPLLRGMIHERASDLHLSAGQKPRWRIDGDLLEIRESRELGKSEVYDMLEPVLPDNAYEEFSQDYSTDFSYVLENLARFRVNMFRDDKGVSAVMRLIPIEIPTFKQLRLPENVKSMSEFAKGLVLVTGPTGSGKSTTLAAILNELNSTIQGHLITLEDPIEFHYKSDKCLVNQREIGPHATSFAHALRASLREDPDIILVGEMRDVDTVALAIEAANTGHLVFGTLHTKSAISTIDRIIDMFPVEQHSKIRSSLSDVLKGVVSQVLLKRKGGGRIAAFETLYVTAAISSQIRQGKTHQIVSAMIGNKRSVLMNEHLEELVKSGHVDMQDAVSSTEDREDLMNRLGNSRGVGIGVSMGPSASSSGMPAAGPQSLKPGGALKSTQAIKSFTK
ncbi:MAG: PilT/PilU family type 4a pilus ATPase [Myxococcales bacterium]|nr:PilT/PilU family type 4a pilus ATPase [Myxococcales bacterium]